MFVNNNHILKDPLIQFTLCLPVYLIGVIQFGKSALRSIQSSIPNMDVLIFIGSSSAFFYSIYGCLLFNGTEIIHNYLFFETSATIITLVLLGNILEKRSVQKTTTAIKDLTDIQKGFAKREIKGKIKEIPFEDIKLNDILLVNSGDKIPTDSIIISGSCLVDESMISGESIPVNKTENERVIGGTIVVEGNIKIQAYKIGEDTLLSKIIGLVKDAEKNKPEIQRLGDKISSVFVPVVILISIITFFVLNYSGVNTQDALLRSIAVLVISCPCAMGLATPTAVMVGIGLAAKRGILIKGGASLEKLANIKNLVFDKTGTLTNGDFIIQDLSIINGSEQNIKNIIFNLEQYSNHPIAKSLCKSLISKSKKLNVENIHEEKGIYIKGDISGNTYKIGSYKIIETDIKKDIYILENNKLIATLNINDKLKEDTYDILKKLHKQYNIILLSGDKDKKCRAISNELNITKMYSEQMPHDKIKKIQELVSSSPTVMIGDGINDAAALAQSTIGISLSNSTDIAIQSSEVILLNNTNLKQLPESLQIAKETLLTIKQNLFWAFSYNIIAIPLAIVGLLNPMWAALFMAFSNIIVIGNSIRLGYKKIF
tara:strand:+ start:52 stop:1851 length:1800 start_codon:yes stop_codon:yes gene_type:complete